MGGGANTTRGERERGELSQGYDTQDGICINTIDFWGLESEALRVGRNKDKKVERTERRRRIDENDRDEENETRNCGEREERDKDEKTEERGSRYACTFGIGSAVMIMMPEVLLKGSRDARRDENAVSGNMDIWGWRGEERKMRKGARD